MGPAQGLGALDHGGPLDRRLKCRAAFGDPAQYCAGGQRDVVELDETGSIADLDETKTSA